MAAPIPAIESYLAALPDGEASHPDCQVKASVLRTALEENVPGRDVLLPPGVRGLIDHPPLVNGWIPEVQFNCLMIAQHALYFGAQSEARYLDWVYERNLRLLRAPLYRALFLVLSPERLLVGMQNRWASFRRGSQLVLARQDPRDVEVHLRTPPNLLPNVAIQGLSQAIRAAMICAGAKSPRVDGDRISPTVAACRVRWS